MRANLPKLEPKLLADWEKKNIYRRLREKRAGSPRFLLHDGPPYANGELHMGHALNKTLKDIIVRYKALAGFDTPFVPGWDCHGLPIEHNVTRELGAEAAALSQSEIRQRCRAYAKKYVGIQREGFKRIGCIGDWPHPYLTMDPLFESRIIEAFGALHKRGFIYRGQKPIHWCPSCRTALAASTAEAEYANHITHAITVAFASKDDASVSILIWTTTPWTIPANLAVAVRPDLKYVTVRTGAPGTEDRRFILAEALLPRVASESGWSDYVVESEEFGSAMEGKEFRHPFIDRTVKVILGEFVTTDAGTGVVHIAPGHGHDDYIVGTRYHLPVLSPVDDAGRFTAEATVCEGKFVFDANDEIVALLKSKGSLITSTKIEHQYPHCWRCKGPVIFRATPQWFMSLDRLGMIGDTVDGMIGDTVDGMIGDTVDDGKTPDDPARTLREKALVAAESIQWIPSWGKDRFLGSVRDRPDWCLSRQRSWGVPIPALLCSSCGADIIDAETIAEAARLAREGKLDEWFSSDAGSDSDSDSDSDSEMSNRKCPKCSAPTRRERDILDVWFDSGVSWFAADMIYGGSRGHSANLPHVNDINDSADDVANRQNDPSPPPIADLYLEGSDQHRGWFQSSLWPSLALRGTPPFRAVLTHGFMLDGQGRAMHKSAGNVISPAEVMEKYGADIIRLWVASENFSADLRISNELLAQVAETYRKIRNTWRFIAANIIDLPADFEMPLVERQDIDRWASAILHRYVDRARKAYDAYAFHDVYRATLEFVSSDLSSFYLDILKDRLYCDAAEGASRRAAQVTCREILVASLKLMAPILCFTADEVWGLVTVSKDDFEKDSIHLSDLPAVSSADAEGSEILKRFEPLLTARNEILKAIEEQRAAGVIKSSQMASVIGCFNVLDMETLRRLCQVAELRAGEKLAVTLTEKQKCPRCWRYVDLTGKVCARCDDVISGSVDKLGMSGIQKTGAAA